MALNKVLLIGNVGKDPEIRHLESGTAVATISLATSEKFKDRSGEMREVTEWHTVVAWRNLAELAESYIRKGSQIYVEGRIRTRSWEDQNAQKRYVTEIEAQNIQLLGRRDSASAPSDNSYGQRSYQQPAPARQPAPVSTPVITPAELAEDGPDDLPF